MTDFEQLVAFVKENYPEIAYLLTPGTEIAVGGLIFRPKVESGFTFFNENG
jgi:hypothetical protein